MTLEKEKNKKYKVSFSNFVSDYDPDELQNYLNTVYNSEDKIDYNGVIKVKPVIDKITEFKNTNYNNMLYEYSVEDVYTDEYNSIDYLLIFFRNVLVDEIFGEKQTMPIYIFKMYDKPVGGFLIECDGVKLLYCSFQTSDNRIFELKEDDVDADTEEGDDGEYV